ncbi:MAG: M28 family peptidase [Balneolaceae bacterium]
MAVRIPLLLLLLFVNDTLVAQSEQSPDRIRDAVVSSEVENIVRFLSSDELRGREIGTPEIDIAARYLSTWLQAYGARPLPGRESYFQHVSLRRISSPESGRVSLADSSFHFPDYFVALNSTRGEVRGELLLLEYGSAEEIDGLDLTGKIIVTRPGLNEDQGPRQWMEEGVKKRERIEERGGLALIEIYESPILPWQVIAGSMNESHVTLADPDEQDERQIPHIWMNGSDTDIYSFLSPNVGREVTIQMDGGETDYFSSRNVVGFIEGKDPERKDEFLLLGAHYDHIGTRDVPDSEDGIYNGARDNAVGTAAILLAARYFAEHPPDRSVLFAAWTAEEVGLLGSSYFAENPVVPLEQIVYKLNIDGAGYNDTTKVLVIGLERTTAEGDLRHSASAFGLEAITDPVPEQNLFDRSDNVNFARKGIPAPTYSLGLTSFDEEIRRYYHTVEDEADTINYSYVTAYIRSFILAAQQIANSPEVPFWREGDPYEGAGIELYGR